MTGLVMALRESRYYRNKQHDSSGYVERNALRGSGVFLVDRDSDMVGKEIDCLVSNADYRKKILDTERTDRVFTKSLL